VKQVTASGKTTEEAVQAALELLQVTRERAEIRILDEGKKGLFGIFGAKRAIVQAVRIKTPAEQAEEYLIGILSQLVANSRIERREKGKKVYFELFADAAGIEVLIDKNGQVLNALQELVQLHIHTTGSKYAQVELDAGGYRTKRKETLRNLAMELAEKAIKTGRKTAFEPMPSYERKWVHACLQNRKDLETSSIGKEPYRHILIEPKSN